MKGYAAPMKQYAKGSHKGSHAGRDGSLGTPKFLASSGSRWPAKGKQKMSKSAQGRT